MGLSLEVSSNTSSTCKTEAERTSQVNGIIVAIEDLDLILLRTVLPAEGVGHEVHAGEGHGVAVRLVAVAAARRISDVVANQQAEDEVELPTSKTVWVEKRDASTSK